MIALLAIMGLLSLIAGAVGESPLPFIILALVVFMASLGTDRQAQATR